MSPVAFISHFHIKEGELDAARAAVATVLTQLKGSRPRTAAQLAFVDERGERLSILHVFPDAEAMDLHVEGAAERSKAAYELFEPAGWEVYGTPSAAALNMIEDQAAEWGVPVKFEPEALGGFLRFS
jgi:uncharacterized protein (DUF2126 family)